MTTRKPVNKPEPERQTELKRFVRIVATERTVPATVPFVLAVVGQTAPDQSRPDLETKFS